MVTDDTGWSQMLSDASRWYQMCSYGHFEKGIRNKSADKGFLRVRYASPVVDQHITSKSSGTQEQHRQQHYTLAHFKTQKTRNHVIIVVSHQSRFTGMPI